MYRFLTQDLLTGAFLNTELPVSDASVGYALNAPGSFTGSLTPRYVRVDPVRPGRTAIYVERDSSLIWGGVVWNCTPKGPIYEIEAATFSSYLSHRHDLHGNLNGRGPWTYADPTDVLRGAWAYAQEQADGDMGVVVDATTSTAKVGTPGEPLKTDWWETQNLGALVTDLTSADDGFDYTDEVSWSGPTTSPGDPVRRLRVGYPRLGRRRTDISFRTGVNIRDAPALTYSADEYAQVVIGVGAGDGSARIMATDAVRNEYPRLEHVEEQSMMKGVDQLAKFIRTERIARSTEASITAITAVDHPSAAIGSFDVGDDVLVAVHDEWTDLERWCRIVGYTVSPSGDSGETIDLELAGADSFHYGAPA